MEDSIAVVVVTYDSAADLTRSLPELLPQLREGDRLVIVDNCSRDDTVAVASELAPGAVVVQRHDNAGFAGGCNEGAALTEAPLLLFLNPDARPLPGCLDALRATAAQRPGWGAWQALVTLPGGRRVNTSGGITHYLGFGWAGAHGRPVDEVSAEPEEVSFASGAALVVRRGVWDRLGGFDADYFMYGEDLDLSLRVWLTGDGVGVVPAARVEHDYDFDKGRRKWFLLECNRWRTLVGDYPTLLLALLLPALLVFELALLGVAARGGWLAEKVRAQAWVARSLPALFARRRRVQGSRRASDSAFAARLDSRLDSEFLDPVAKVAILAALQRSHWRLVLMLLRAARR